MKKRILALSRDRGSMQAITPVLRALSESGMYDLSICAARESMPVIVDAGLSAILLDETSFEAEPASLLEQLIESERPDLLLTGSSPARGRPPETPEQHAIRLCHKIGVPSLSVMDYWGMYTERFCCDGSNVSPDLVPDRLCVLDNRSANDLIRIGVSADRIVATHNPWLDALATVTIDMNASSPQDQDMAEMKVLLVSQPLAAMRSVRNWTYDQFTLFRWLATALSRLDTGKSIKLQVALHPSEPRGPWQDLLRSCPPGGITVELLASLNPKLLETVDYVATSHSTLAYEALYFGTPCISLRPDTDAMPPLWMEELGLSRVFHDEELLFQFLAGGNSAAERNRILDLKRSLAVKGLFFSDGHATERVIRELQTLMEMGPSWKRYD